MDLRDRKRALRRRVMAARDCLSPAEVRSRSEALLSHLQGLSDYAGAKAVHCFVPFGTEVDTRLIIEDLWQRGAAVVVPRVTGPGAMDHAIIETWADLEPGFKGIPEPHAACALAKPESLELLLVPGLAFDHDGGRLGYGGGFYDRFLDACPAPRVALAFELQLVDEVPREAHDLLVHRIVTDTRVIVIA